MKRWKLKRSYIWTLLISLTINSSFCLPDCSDALKKCTEYNLTLEQAVKLRDDKISILLKQRDEAVQIAKEAQPLLPAWGYVIIGMAAGSLLVIGLRK